MRGRADGLRWREAPFSMTPTSPAWMKAKPRFPVFELRTKASRSSSMVRVRNPAGKATVGDTVCVLLGLEIRIGW